VLIIELKEAVKEIPFDLGAYRTERGKQSMRCQSNGVFVAMTSLMSLLSTKAKEGGQTWGWAG